MHTQLDIRLAYHADTGYYPIKNSNNDSSSLIADFSENQEEEIDVYDEDGEPATIENPLFPLLDYIKWLEERILTLENK